MVDMQVTGGMKQLGGGYTYVDLKAMSTFTFDQNNGTINDVPAKWRELDGKKVVLHGEMWEPTGAGPTVDELRAGLLDRQVLLLRPAADPALRPQRQPSRARSRVLRGDRRSEGDAARQREERHGRGDERLPARRRKRDAGAVVRNATAETQARRDRRREDRERSKERELSC